MKENPYSGLYNLMRSAGAGSAPESAARLRLGKVLSVAPLKISVAGTDQEEARFYICDRLRDGHKENLSVSGTNVSGALSISASCQNGSHSSMTISSGTVALSAVATQAGSVLRAGDQVLLLTDDDQTFYIIDKVVNLG